MIKEPQVSPGFYATQVYEFVSELDPDFKSNVTTDQFIENVQDKDYVASLYSLIQANDPDWEKNKRFEDFVDELKKKDASEFVSDVGSSEQQKISDPVFPWKEIDYGQEGYVDPYAKDADGLTSLQKSAKEVSEKESAAEQAALKQQGEEFVLNNAQEIPDIREGFSPVARPESSGVMQPFNDQVVSLRDTYGEYGFSFEPMGKQEGSVREGTLRNVPTGIKIISAHNGLESNSHIIEVDEQGQPLPGELDRAEIMLNQSKVLSMAPQDEGVSAQALRARDIRPVARHDRFGRNSSHLMIDFEEDGKYKVAPTLFPNDPQAMHSHPSLWKELNYDAAIKEARRRGEIFEFDTKEEAQAFAKGSWKDVETIDLEAERMYAERGRNYYADRSKFDRINELSEEIEFINALPVIGDYEGEVPKEYAQHIKDGYVSSSWQLSVSELEAELNLLNSQVDTDAIQRLDEDFDAVLGKRQTLLSTEAAEVNLQAKVDQDNLQIESLDRFGTSIEGLVNYEPTTIEELNEVNQVIGKFNAAITDRMFAARKYEKAQLYYDKKHNKAVTDNFIDGYEEFKVAFNNGLKRGNAMNILLRLQDGEELEGDEESMAYYMGSQDPRLGRAATRVGRTPTDSLYWSTLGNNFGGYVPSIAAQSFGMLLPIGATIVPRFAIAGAAMGAIQGSVAGPLGTGVGAIGGAISGVGYGLAVGMGLAEYQLEMGNAILDAGYKNGYDWTDPDQALLAFNDKKVWAEGERIGHERGVPIGIAGAFSAGLAGRVFTTARLASISAKGAAFLSERFIMDPALEMAGEYAALVNSGQYTGSLENRKEIMAEGLGAIGQSTPFAAFNIAGKSLNNSNFSLAMTLLDPKELAKENVSNARIVGFADNLEKLGKISSAVANGIRRNTGFRRVANELLGRKAGARPGRYRETIGRMMELLEAKDMLSSTNMQEIFRNRIKEINEELAYIAENGFAPSTPIANLDAINARTQSQKPSGYRIGRKVYETSADFTAALDKITSIRQLRNAEVYNDLDTEFLLSKKYDELKKGVKPKKAAAVKSTLPTVAEEDYEEVEATQEDVAADLTEEGIEDIRKKDILGTIAAKQIKGDPLTDAEEAISKQNTELLKRIREDAEELAEARQAEEAAKEEEVDEGTVPTEAAPKKALTLEEAVAENKKLDIDRSQAYKEYTRLRDSDAPQKEVDAAKAIYDSVSAASDAALEAKKNAEKKAEEAAPVEEAAPEAAPVKKATVKKKAKVKKAEVEVAVEEAAPKKKAAPKKAAPKKAEKAAPVEKAVVEEAAPKKAAPAKAAPTEETETTADEVAKVFKEIQEIASTDITSMSSKSVQEIWDKIRALYREIIEAEALEESERNEVAAALTTLRAEVNKKESEEAAAKKKEAAPEAAPVEAEKKTVPEKEAEKVTELTDAEVTAEAQAEVDQKLKELEELEGNRKDRIQRILKGPKDKARYSIEVATREMDGPISNKKQEIEEAKARLDIAKKKQASNPLDVIENSSDPEAIYDAFKSVREASEILFALSKNKNLSEFQRTLALNLSQRLLGTGVTIKQNNRIRNPGQYKRTTVNNTVSESSIDLGKLSKSSLVHIVEVILHESAHAVTAIDYDSIDGKTRAELDRLSKLINDYYIANKKAILKKYPGIKRAADAKNIKYLFSPKELLAYGLTNEEYQQFLKEIKDPEGKTVWSSFVESIRKLLGLDKKYATALDSLLSAYEESIPYGVGDTVEISIGRSRDSMLSNRSDVYVSGKLYEAAKFYGVNTKGFMPDNAQQNSIDKMRELLEENGLTLAKARNGSLYVVRGRKPFNIYAVYKQQQEISENEEAQDRLMESKRQEALDLEERLRDIHEADGRPYTGEDLTTTSVDYKKDVGNILEDLSSSMKMEDTINAGRELGVSDSAIRAVLLNRGVKPKEITKAIAIYYKDFDALPKAFGNVEGGISVGVQIYSDVRRGVESYMRPPLRSLRGKQRTERIAELRKENPKDKELTDTQILRRYPRERVLADRTRDDIVAESLNILRNNNLFNQQPLDVQQELIVAMHQSLNTKTNLEVESLIESIRREMVAFKQGGKDLKASQAQLRKLVRTLLIADSKVKKSKYSVAEVNKLINMVNSTTKTNYLVKAQNVLKIVEEHRAGVKTDLLKQMEKWAYKKAAPRKSSSGKPLSSGLDAAGQAFFRAMAPILRAFITNDSGKIQEISNLLSNDVALNEAISAYKAGESITVKQQSLIDKAVAFDMLSDIGSMNLEETVALFNDIKKAAAFSRMALKESRLIRAEDNQVIQEEASASLSEIFGVIINNEDGTAKTPDEIAARKSEIKAQWRSAGFKDKLKMVFDTAGELRITAANSVVKSMRIMTHLGTLSNVLGPYFYDNLYRPMGRMEERFNSGVRDQYNVFNDMANAIDGIDKGYKQIVDMSMSRGDTFRVSGLKTGNTIKAKGTSTYARSMTPDEVMRLVALSQNATQRNKMAAMGITDEVLAEAEVFLGPQLNQFVLSTVDYFSNEYGESINSVYRSVNDVNLDLIDNYFPTRSESETADITTLLEGKNVEFFNVFQMINQDSFKSRSDLLSPILLSDNRGGIGFIGVTDHHIKTMERYKAFAEGTRKMDTLFKNGHLKATLTSLNVEAPLRLLINQAINPNAYSSEIKFPTIDKLVRNYTLAALAFKIWQIPKQLSSFAAAVGRYNYTPGKPNFIVDLVMFSVEYAMLVPDMFAQMVTLGKYEGAISEAMDISSTFAHRMDMAFSGDISGLESGAATFTNPKQAHKKVNRIVKGLRAAGGTTTSIGDIGAVMAYMVTYRRDIANGMDPDEALEHFNDYNTTQQSRRPGERVPIQIWQNGLTRMFTAFTSSLILYLNNTIRHANNISRDLRLGNSVKASDVRGLAFNAVLGNVMFGAVSNSLILLMGKDDDDSEEFVSKTLSAPLQTLFMWPVLGREMEETYAYWTTGKALPGRAGLNIFGKMKRDVKNNWKEGGYVKAAAAATGLAVGSNFDPFFALHDIIKDGEFETENVLDVLGIPDSQRPSD